MSWWEWDIENNKVATGKEKYTMLGYSAEDLKEGFEWWTSLLHDDDYDNVMKAMHDHLSGKTSAYDVEYRIRRKDNTYAWYHDKGAIVKRDKKNNAQMLIGVVMNITDKMERQQAHINQIQTRENRLNYIYSKNEKLYKTMHEGIVFQDQNGFIVDANPAAEKILGVSLNAMKERTSEDPEWKPLREDKSEFPGKEHPSMQALSTGKIIKDVKMGVYNPKRKKYVWINITAIPFSASANNNTTEVYAIFHEINENKA
jgi:PAS domain S-box-containing protein